MSWPLGHELTSNAARCLACNYELEPILAAVGALRCQDCRDSNRPIVNRDPGDETTASHAHPDHKEH